MTRVALYVGKRSGSDVPRFAAGGAAWVAGTDEWATGRGAGCEAGRGAGARVVRLAGARLVLAGATGATLRVAWVVASTAARVVADELAGRGRAATARPAGVDGALEAAELCGVALVGTAGREVGAAEVRDATRSSATGRRSARLIPTASTAQPPTATQAHNEDRPRPQPM